MGQVLDLHLEKQRLLARALRRVERLSADSDRSLWSFAGRAAHRLEREIRDREEGRWCDE